MTVPLSQCQQGEKLRLNNNNYYYYQLLLGKDSKQKVLAGIKPQVICDGLAEILFP